MVITESAGTRRDGGGGSTRTAGTDRTCATPTSARRRLLSALVLAMFAAAGCSADAAPAPETAPVVFMQTPDQCNQEPLNAESTPEDIVRSLITLRQTSIAEDDLDCLKQALGSDISAEDFARSLLEEPVEVIVFSPDDLTREIGRAMRPALGYQLDRVIKAGGFESMPDYQRVSFEASYQLINDRGETYTEHGGFSRNGRWAGQPWGQGGFNYTSVPPSMDAPTKPRRLPSLPSGVPAQEGLRMSCSDFLSLTPEGRLSVIVGAAPSRGIEGDYLSIVSWQRTVTSKCKADASFGTVGDTGSSTVGNYLDRTRYIPDAGDPAAGVPRPY
jgi:hypothetical protein